MKGTTDRTNLSRESNKAHNGAVLQHARLQSNKVKGFFVQTYSFPLKNKEKYHAAVGLHAPHVILFLHHSWLSCNVELTDETCE